MRTKQLLWLLAAACAAVVLGVVATRISSRSTAPGAAMGTALFPDLPVNEVEAITVTDAFGTMEVCKKGGVWCVPSRGGYPANFAAVAAFLTGAADMKAVQVMQAGESQYGRLQLQAPGKGAGAGVEVGLRLAGGKSAGHFILGKYYEVPRASDGAMAYDDGQGRFILVPETKTVAVTNANLGPITSGVVTWIDATFLHMLEVKNVSLKAEDETLWRLVRASAGGGLLLDGIKAEETSDQDKVNRAGAVWNWNRFADVAGKCATAPEAKAEFKHELRFAEFTGCEFVIRLGNLSEDKKTRRIMVDAIFTPVPRVPAKDETPEAKKKAEEDYAKTQAENRKRVEDLKKIVDGWIYLMPTQVVASIPMDRKQFLKPAANRN